MRLHESKDLKNWNLLPSPLTTTLLDMKGNPPAAFGRRRSRADGQFWLVYTDVKVTEGAFKDMTNYLTTAKDIRGPWSDPIKLNGVGFDASLFHDDDGRKYIVQQTRSPGVPSPLRWHYLNGAGYQDAEVNAGNRAHHLPRHRRGAGRGPHLYKLNGYYYLFAARAAPCLPTGGGGAVENPRGRQLKPSRATCS